MSLPRFFYPDVIEPQAILDLPKELAHYMQRVLRLTDQTHITLFNGQGGEFTAQIHYEGKQVRAHILTFISIERELPLRLTIAQGLATGDKMDWICEKSVEMGAYVLQPIAAQHSTLKLSGERLEKRLQHWQRIAQSASEQCGRNQVLQVQPLRTLHQLCQSLTPDDLLLFCDPDAPHHFPDAIDQAISQQRSHWILLIGPEGGWSDAEKKIALNAGAISMRFGARVLRTETAAIALVGAIRGQLGWIE